MFAAFILLYLCKAPFLSLTRVVPASLFSSFYELLLLLLVVVVVVVVVVASMNYYYY